VELTGCNARHKPRQRPYWGVQWGCPCACRGIAEAGDIQRRGQPLALLPYLQAERCDPLRCTTGEAARARERGAEAGGGPSASGLGRLWLPKRNSRGGAPLEAAGAGSNGAGLVGPETGEGNPTADTFEAAEADAMSRLSQMFSPYSAAPKRPQRRSAPLAPRQGGVTPAPSPPPGQPSSGWGRRGAQWRVPRVPVWAEEVGGRRVVAVPGSRGEGAQGLKALALVSLRRGSTGGPQGWLCPGRSRGAPAGDG